MKSFVFHLVGFQALSPRLMSCRLVAPSHLHLLTSPVCMCGGSYQVQEK